MVIETNQLGQEDDHHFQARMLDEVSRSFALTIPVLPPPLCDAVGNAYLLCRIADTIEDETALTVAQKKEFSDQLMVAFNDQNEAKLLAENLTKCLSDVTTIGEKELIAEIPRVIGILHGLSQPQREAIEKCVRIMSTGMMEFQVENDNRGLQDLSELNRYCYCAAGVVGEMLTELFCDYSSEINEERQRLFQLSVSFGQVLQMTNILQDMWEDRQRGACWLPRDVFEKLGLELDSVTTYRDDPRYENAIIELLGIARFHLDQAVKYILLIPTREIGIRQHCIRALGMSVLTLRRIHATPTFTEGEKVKISHTSLRAVLFSSGFMARSNLVLRQFFAILTRKLPHCSEEQTVLQG